MGRITNQNFNPEIPSMIHSGNHPTGTWLMQCAALFILLAQSSWGQVSLSLSSPGANNGTMLLNFVLNSTSGSEPSAVQWTLTYPASSVTQSTVAAGAQASAASKTVTCNTVSGSQMCVVSGMNATKILNGIVATATLQLASSTTGTPSGIVVANALGASASAASVPVSATSTIQIVPVVGSLGCSPTSLTAPASTSCTVTVSAAAPSAGTVVSLGTAATGITLSSPASVTVASGQTTATFSVSVTGATSSGTASVTASLNGSSVSASLTVGTTSTTTPPVSGGGSLSGSGNSVATGANLTTEGSADWVHWGDGSVPGVNRKSGVTAQISGYTVVGSGAVSSYTNDPRPLSWSDGTPTASNSHDLKGVFISKVGNGFSITAPADTSSRTLTVHVGGWSSAGTLTAHLSDGSAANYVDTTAAATGQYDRNYTLTYNAASAGQTLTVTWVMASGAGNVTLNGAALH